MTIVKFKFLGLQIFKHKYSSFENLYKVFGVEVFKRKSILGIERIKLLGIPIIVKKNDSNRYKMYVLGIRIHNHSIPMTTQFNSDSNVQRTPSVDKVEKKSFLNLRQQDLNIAFKFEGGLGDMLIATNYLVEFKRKFLVANFRIDVFSHGKGKLLDLIFNNQNLVNNLYSGDIDIDLKDTHYDLHIHAVRKVVICHYNKVKIYEYSPDLLKYIQQIEFENAMNFRQFKNRPFCDCQIQFQSSIMGMKRFQELDPFGFLSLSENFSYTPSLRSDFRKFLDSFGLTCNQYITIHRGVDEMHSLNSLKQWPINYYNILIRLIKRDYPNLKIVQLGVSSDRCPSFDNVDLNLVGNTSLDDLKILLRFSLVHIDGEGGMVHLRHALKGGSSVVLFGPTSSKYYGYTENFNIQGNSCNANGCEWLLDNGWETHCARNNSYHSCMKSIIPEKVYENVKLVLDKENV